MKLVNRFWRRFEALRHFIDIHRDFFTFWFGIFIGFLLALIAF